MKPREDPEGPQEAAKPARKPYASPRLTVHGDMAKITRGTLTGTKESLTSAL